MYISIILSIVAIIVSFVLAILALIAGKSIGFIEDYYILMLNTSKLGKNLILILMAGGSNLLLISCGPLKGPLGKLCASAIAKAGSAVDSVILDLSIIENNIANKLAAKLGIC